MLLGQIGTYSAGNVLTSVGGGLFKGARRLLTSGPIGYGMGGAAIGGIAGVATGDNYSSTATMGNFVGGALAGATIGGLGRAFAPTVARGASNYIGAGAAIRNRSLSASPLFRNMRSVGRVGSGIIRGGIGLGRLASRAPKTSLAVGGAAVAGGIAWAMSGNNAPNLDDASNMTNYSSGLRDLQNSAAGLSLGLHRARHK